MNRLRPSSTVYPRQGSTLGGSHDANRLKIYNQREHHNMTTQTTLPVQDMTCTGCENRIRFALTSRGSVRQINPGHPAKSVEVDYDPDLIRSNGIRRGVEDIEYREMAS